MLTLSCANEDTVSAPESENNNLAYLSPKKLEVCRLVANEVLKDHSILTTNKGFEKLGEVKLETLLNSAHLKSDVIKQEISILEQEGIPGCFVHNYEKLNNSNFSNLKIMFAPFNDDAQQIEGVDLNGNIVTLKTDTEYDGVILFIDQHGRFEHEKNVARYNKEIAALEHNSKPENPETKSALSLDIQVMKELRMVDDHEPWFKGDPEIYMNIVDYKTTNTSTATPLRTVDLEWFNDENHTYNINQHFILWQELQEPKVATAIFMEADSGYNYASLAGSILNSATFVGITLSPVTPAQKALFIADAISLTNQIVTWIGQGATDGDDYVDQINLIQKNPANGVGDANNITYKYQYQ